MNEGKYTNKDLKPSFNANISYLIAKEYHMKRTLRLEENKLNELSFGCDNNNYTLMSKVESMDAYQRIVECIKYLERIHEEIDLFLQEISEERRKQFFSSIGDELYSLRKKQEFVEIDLKLTQEEIDLEQTVFKEIDSYFDKLRGQYCA